MFGEGLYKEPQAYMQYLHAPRTSKAEQGLAFKVLASKYCGEGKRWKKKSIDGKPLPFAHRAKKLELQIRRMQDKLNFLSSPELLV